MQRARRRDTRPEQEIRKILHAAGLRYRVDHPIPGTRRRADISFPRKRVSVFIDGCFWHGCPEHASWPRHNAEWWRNKIEATRQRDADTNERLRSRGWTVIRIWEHEDPFEAAERVMRAISE